LLVLLREEGRYYVAAAAGECGAEPVGRYATIEVYSPEGALGAVRRLGVEARAALLAPLSFHGRPLGAIIAFDRLEEGPDFYAEDERLLVGAAASASTAVATVLSATEERLRQSLGAAERERARWARELHDSILQGLASRRLLLSSALKKGAGPQLEAAVGEALEDMGRDIDELRSLITELRPATLDQLGLRAALEDLTERFEHNSGIEVEVDLQLGAKRLDPDLETAVYRLVQESLTNVAKHATAGGVTLQLTAGDGRLDVLISDDGQGFDQIAERSGFGLAGMRERVELAGGELQIESILGSGTRVMASLPLSAKGDVESRARGEEISSE